jgi:hypothetical protein
MKRIVILVLAIVFLIAIAASQTYPTLHAQQCHAVFDSMEVTQVIQYKDNGSHPDNSVPLVAQRGTTVRVYMQPSGNCVATGIDGALEFYATPGTATVVHIGASDNGPITVSPNDTNLDRRHVPNKTLN